MRGLRCCLNFGSGATWRSYAPKIKPHSCVMELTFEVTVLPEALPVCMAILPMPFKHMRLPDIMLCDSVLSYVDSYKYLDSHISNSCSKSDDLELRHQYRLLCCRSNSLIRKFSMCSYDVKRFLYSTYCPSVSCVYLWHSYRASVFRKFMVCFNNAARMFSDMIVSVVHLVCFCAKELTTLTQCIEKLYLAT